MSEVIAESPVRISKVISDMNLEPYLLQLEVDGLAVVPPEVHGFGMDRFDEMVELILTKAQEMTGSPFTLEGGPELELTFPGNSRGLSAFSAEAGQPTQFLIQQLGRMHRIFRDLAVNRAAIALIRQMIGSKSTRFSSHNSFVKWQGDYGYGSSLGLHADQTALPLPWGRTALTANTNWCLTDYTLEGGALAYVPGSHRRGTRPTFPHAAKEAIPVVAPKGSLIVFHGATWHGAFPRKIPGMRISVANYYRHLMVTSQEDIQGSFPRELADDCDDPELFKELAGFEDAFPYQEPGQPVPRVEGS
jgi:hypothetical protein